jgi:AcrR family transcriptional regulator
MVQQDATRVSVRRGSRDTRHRLLAAAAAAIIEGSGEFEIGDVARRAQASVGLTYHHFGSKAGLLTALIDDFYNRHDALANQRLDAKLPWAVREQQRLRASVQFMYEDPLAPIIVGRLGGSAEVVALEAAHRAAMVEQASRNISVGQKAGQIDTTIDATIAAAAIIGGIRQAVATALASKKPPPQEKLVRQLWSFVAGGLQLGQVDQ